MTKKPSYRFAGYTEPWEQRKLGECTEISAGGDIEKSKLLNNGKYPVIANALTSDGIVGYYNDSYRIEAPAVTVTGRGDVGVAKARNVNFTPVVRLLSLKSEHDVIFLENAINTQKIVIESTGVPQLTAPQLGRYKIFFPSLPEQTAIGSFFQDIDQLISLQQRKLEVLKEQKKTYLKLLFPAKGQKKPALRFAGFEDEWKEVKLGEIGEIQTGNTPPTNEEDNYEKNGFPWVTPTDINSLVLHTTSKQLSEVGKSKARIAKSGSILVTCIASIGKNTLVRTDSAFNQQINSLTPSEKYSSYFLLTQSEIWSRYMLSVAGAGTMQIINKSDFSNIKTMVPSLPEQEAIGSFFQDLDKAIAKQEEKVNQLKESKQTLLRKMFI